MTELDDAAASLARGTMMSFEQAKASLARLGHSPTQVWIDETQWKGATNMPDVETDPHMFATREGITKADLGDALREYRSLDTWPGSPWADGEIGVLSTDFISWYRWERL